MSYLPGDLSEKQLLEQMIRVDHAGEYGAKRIYQGQIAILKKPEEQKLLKHMAEQEAVHLEYFTELMQQRKVRPSILFPFWHIFGYALGACTAILGKDAAMICTEAVEEVIDDHYTEQLRQLEHVEEPELKEKIITIREEEIEHRNLASNNLQNPNIAHQLLYKAIKLGCRISIALAKRF